jgi:hypothetical protein
MNCITGLGTKTVLKFTLALAGLLGVAFPISSQATSITNSRGSLSGSSSGLSLSSNVTAVGGMTGLGTLGTLKITTGALTSGTLGGGAQFNGGTITITAAANGIANGLPAGVGGVFQGTFVGPVTWSVNAGAHGTLTYVLSGAVQGIFFSGGSPDGGTTQITMVLTSPFNGSRVRLQGGLTTLSGASTVPEPGTLGLMGTGLIGIAFLARRKLKPRRDSPGERPSIEA